MRCVCVACSLCGACVFVFVSLYLYICSWICSVFVVGFAVYLWWDVSTFSAAGACVCLACAPLLRTSTWLLLWQITMYWSDLLPPAHPACPFYDPSLYFIPQHTYLPGAGWGEIEFLRISHGGGVVLNFEPFRGNIWTSILVVVIFVYIIYIFFCCWLDCLELLAFWFSRKIHIGSGGTAPSDISPYCVCQQLWNWFKSIKDKRVEIKFESCHLLFSRWFCKGLLSILYSIRNWKIS